MSRWTGTPVNLKLPEDFKELIGVDIGYTSEDERVKNLVYYNINGEILAKEYREGFIDRNFEGWIEVVKK